MTTDDKLLDAWSNLLDSRESQDERTVQSFLEAHPSLLPGHHTLDTSSGHHPWPYAVISQPPLPALSTKVPDFMWISRDSVFLYPVLIEIETPWKRWFHSSSLTQHSDLTTAMSQIGHWRRWFSKGTNQVAFYDYYRIPRELQDLTLAPRFVIVHGRRSEANASPSAISFRGGLPVSDDTRLVTFDHLHPDPRAEGYFTVSISESGYKLHVNSPPITYRELPDYLLAAGAGLYAGIDHRPAIGYRFSPPNPRN